MTTFTREQLDDLSEYRGISTEGDLAVFALAMLDRAETAEAERDRLRAQLDSILANSDSLESGKLADAHAENKRLREELAEAEEALRACVTQDEPPQEYQSAIRRARERKT